MEKCLKCLITYLIWYKTILHPPLGPQITQTLTFFIQKYPTSKRSPLRLADHTHYVHGGQQYTKSYSIRAF